MNRNVKSKRKVRRGMEEEEEKGRRFEDCDLVGFSRTDVCIIDSSSPLWKFDKYLFRKKNVWKARDYWNVRPRNNNSVAIARKKKREAVDDQDEGGIVVRKKSILLAAVAANSKDIILSSERVQIEVTDE
ncbi:hypothetical protein QQ045_031717 [Rhodiola kirilowii]